MAKKEDLHVGQRVLLGDVNRRAQDPGTIEKIGRTLVYIKNDRIKWAAEPYRIDTQHSNDSYGHGYFLTEEQAEEKAIREDLSARARQATGENWVHIFRKISIDKAREIVTILERSE